MDHIELTAEELAYSEKQGFSNLPPGNYLTEPGETLQISPSGIATFFLNGRVHRKNGPACIFPGRAYQWRKEGMLHRENGPAFVWEDGKIEFWLNNRKFWSRKEWKRALVGMRLKLASLMVEPAE